MIAFGRSVTEQLGPITTAAAVYLIGGTLGVTYLAARGRLLRTFSSFSRAYLLGCGGLFVANNLSMYLAIGLAADRSQVLEVGLINYLWPVLTLLASVAVLRLRVSLLVVPGVILATTGIFLTVTQNQPIAWDSFAANVVANRTAYIAALAAAVTWALYSALSRKHAAGGDGEAVPVFMLATGVILGMVRLVYPEESHVSADSLVELLYLSLGPNLAYLFWEYAMRKGDLVLVVSASYFTPFLSTLVSCAYLSVAAGPKLWAGCALIVAGAIVCRKSVKTE